MNLRDALLHIAVAFETPPEDRTDEQKELTHMGVCWAVEFLEEKKSIDHETKLEVQTLAMDEVERVNWSPTRLYQYRTSAGDKTRAAFCREQVLKLVGHQSGEAGKV